MKLIENLIVAFSMYSKIPMPHIEWNKENMRYTLCFFPLIGCVIGLLNWAWFRITLLADFHSSFVTAVFLLIPILVTGGIHMDGLLDTADALSSWQPRERRLEILKDSHAGAFAIITCCCYFIALFGIWSQITPKALLVLGVGFSLSRALSGYGVAVIPCAKGSGLAHTFAEAADRKICRRVLTAEIVLCAGTMTVIDPVRGAFAAAAAFLTFLACRRMALRKFGGTTGDIQGFFLQMCELIMTFAAVLGGALCS